jgi:hypothetical protein
MSRRMKRVPIPHEDLFENETPPAMVEQSEAISEAKIDEEVEAVDKMLDGDDAEFEKLEY